MKKRNKLFAVVLVLALSMIMVLPVGATSGTIEVDCDGARFTGTVAAGDTVVLEVRLHPGPAWMGTPILDQYITQPDGPFDVFVPWNDPDGVVDGQGYRVAIVVNGTNVAHEEGILDCPPPPGGEGCTPGYWKNHLEDWSPTGYKPDDPFQTVFGVDLGFATLGDAIVAKGGGDAKVARHGTAALLSASHPDVDYPFTAVQVIASVQLGDVDDLVAANELGCQIP